MSNLKVFWKCLFCPHSDHLQKKLDPICRKAIFVGYPLENKGYEVYEGNAKRFTRYRDVVFHENKFHTFDEVTNCTFVYKDNMMTRCNPMMSEMS